MGGGLGNQVNNNMAGMNAFQMGLMNQSQGGGVGMGSTMSSGGGMGGGTGAFNHIMAAPQAPNKETPLTERKDSAGSGGNDSGLESASATSLSVGATTIGNSVEPTSTKTPEERAALLQTLKEDIAKRERDMAELEASLAAGTGDEDAEDVDSSSRDAKRVKKDDDDVESTAV